MPFTSFFAGCLSSGIKLTVKGVKNIWSSISSSNFLPVFRQITLRPRMVVSWGTSNVLEGTQKGCLCGLDSSAALGRERLTKWAASSSHDEATVRVVRQTGWHRRSPRGRTAKEAFSRHVRSNR